MPYLKKILFFALLFVSFTTSVFAECNLDESRWKWLFSIDQYGCYYDRNTAKIKSASTFEVWTCDYYPGHSSCNSPECVNSRINNTEHYHYWLTEFNSNRYTYTAKYLLIRDTNGNVIDSIDGSSYAKPSSIMPDSVGEDTMLKIKQDLYKNRR